MPGSPKIARMSFPAKDDKALYPLHVLIFRANGVMSHPDARADLIERFGAAGASVGKVGSIFT